LSGAERLAPLLDGSLFLWNFNEKHGCADVSDLQELLHLGVSDVRIESHKTGAVKLFKLEEIIRDREGEVWAWKFRATGGFTVTIYND